MFETIKKIFNDSRFFNGLYIFLILFILGSLVYGATPNPGHPWTEIGDGMWASTNTVAYRTFTFPDATATVMTTLGISQGDIIYGSGASTTASLPKDTTTTHYLSNGSSTNNNNPYWDYINLATGVTGSSSLANGGTATSLTANNGGIVYSGAASLAILAGNSTAGKVLQSGASAAPTWSTAVYPSAAGAMGNVLMSNGTNWVSTYATTSSVSTMGPASNGIANSATSTASLTVFAVGIFNIPGQITVNRISTSMGTVTTAGTMKQCIYNEYGAKLIDVTSGTPVSNTTLTTTVSPAVTLSPGMYYIATGCATACNNLFKQWQVNATGPYTTVIPPNKKIYEGLVTMTSGTCNATLPAITARASSTPVGRLDN